MAFQGASVKGPYKRWIPQSDPLLSESETEAPKRNTARPSRNPPSAQAADIVVAPSPSTVDDPSYLNAHVSSARNPVSSSRHYASTSQHYRSDRTQYGYSSESTIHGLPPQPSTRQNTSGFGVFRPHIKEPKVEPGDAHRREEYHRSATIPAASARPSQSQTAFQVRSNPRDVSTGSAAAFGSFPASSSANPSPHSSTDGHQNGNVSAPQIDKEESRKQFHTTWNPYVDGKLNGFSSTRKPDLLSVTPSSRRSDKKTKDREDMVAKVTEALGGGSTGRARDVEIAILQGQYPSKGDDSSSTRRTASSTTTTKASEGPIRTQVPNLTTPHRQKPLPPSNSHGGPLPLILEGTLRNSRGHAEQQFYTSDSRISSSPSKLNAWSTTTSKVPHSRIATSPWPFNQALPVDTTMSMQPINGSSGAAWKSISRSSGVPTSSKPLAETLTPSKPLDMRSADRTVVSNEQPPDSGRKHKSLDNDKDASRMWQDLPPLPTQDSGRSAPAASHPPKHSSKTYQASTQITSQPSISATAVSAQGVAKLKVDGDLLWSLPMEQSQQASMMKVGSMPNSLQTPRPVNRPTLSDTLTRMTSSDERPIQDADTQSKPTYEGFGGHRRVESSSQVLWSAASKQSATVPTYSVDEPPIRQLATSLSTNTIRPPRTSQVKSISRDQNAQSSGVAHVVWQPPARNQSSIITDEDTVATPFMTDLLENSSTAAWTTGINTQISHSSDVFASLATQSTSRSDPPTPPMASGPESAKSAALKTDRAMAGAWTNGNKLTAETYDEMSTPKLPTKPSLQHTHSSLAPTNKGLRYQSTSTIALNAPVAGAWTASNKLGTSAISIFDSLSPEAKLDTDPATRWEGGLFGSRDATLGTATPAVGTWTTKTLPTEQPQTGFTSTPRPSPPRNSSTPSPVPKLPAQDTGTGTSTPSSAEYVSSAVVQSTSTRVPISGHPSTPAPIRHALRPTPPPLSISSTSPDTDSLLTPSSLNSPQSTLLIAHPQPPSAISVSTIQPPEKEKKSGFLDFFRSKPPAYEIWTPPGRGGNNKDKERKPEPLKEATYMITKEKPSAATPILQPKSPKFFSPLKLFSRRRRTVSSASLDALDGTTTAVLNSPASSMRADTSGGPPSPPLRDAFLATEEWRNKENNDLELSGRKRRPRPGVTFDCPEDIAPANVVPKRYRGSRSPAPETTDDD